MSMVRGDAALTVPDSRIRLTSALTVTVIMPCFNSAATIADSMRCVLEQSLDATDLIVVDDGSVDGTLEIARSISERYPGRVRVLQQAHKGPYPARNLGLAQAQGDCVAFLDADDSWSPDCLQRLRDALLLSDADLAYCGWQNTGPAAANTTPFVPPAYEQGDLFGECLRGCPWPIHAALVRRDVVARVGGFSERMFTSMDYDFWLRLLAHTRRVTRVPAVMAFYYWHGRQISADKSRQVLDAYRVRKEFVDNYPDCVAHLGASRISELTEKHVLRMAYQAYWIRQLPTARALFRAAFRMGICSPKDWPYALLSELPTALVRSLLRRRGSK